MEKIIKNHNCLQQKMAKLYTISKNKSGSCGSDHEILIAKFRFKLKKVGKTTRALRYDPNQIPYDYAVEVTNWFKGLDLIECLKSYGWRFVTLYRWLWSRPSTRKINAFESVLMRWMKLEPIIQSEVSQKDKDQYRILMHIYGI